MSRSLSQSLYRLSLRQPLPPRPPPPRLLSLRAQSNEPSADDADPWLRKLEDAMHCIAVRRSEPDWLPFRPGSSYWVPPRGTNSAALASLIERMANPSLSPEETILKRTTRGWPSSDYFVRGTPPHPAELESTSNNNSQSEDEDG